MSSSEYLSPEFEDFRFQDDEDPVLVQEVVFDGLAHMYEGIDWLELDIDQMGGTTYFVHFFAEGKRELKPYDQLSPEQKRTRDRLRKHLARDLDE